jgi:hypothetical protein
VHKGAEPTWRRLAVAAKRPISEKRLQANRANAKRSTGPRTERGKAVSCRNALKHGILSRTVGMSGEDELLQSAVLSMTSALRLQTSRQKQLVEEIAQTWWRLGRVVKLEYESNARGEAHGNMSSKLMRRYESMLVRQWHARIRESAGLSENGTGESL